MSAILTCFEEKGLLPLSLQNCAVDALDEDFREQHRQPHIAILRFHDLAGQFGQFGNAQQLPTLIVDDQPVLQPIEGDPSAVACPRQHLKLSPVLQIKQFCVDSRRCVPYRLDAIRRAKTSAPCSAAAVAAQAAQSNSGTRGLGLSIAAISRKGFAPGYKEDNQDRCMVVQPFAGANQVLIGVMDGHGVDGHRVSEYIKSSLPGVLRGHLLIGGQTPRKAYVNAFHEVDSLLSTSSGIDAENSGSTAVLGLLQGKQLTTAWVGDSRGVVGVFKSAGQGGKAAEWRAKDLSVDHKPENDSERRRILMCKGRVERTRNRQGQCMGCHRVWLPHANYPGLAMSRAIGDTIVRPFGVTCTPETTTHKLGSRDCFLVFASDGVWEHLSSQDVVELVAKQVGYEPEPVPAPQGKNAWHLRWQEQQEKRKEEQRLQQEEKRRQQQEREEQKAAQQRQKAEQRLQQQQRQQQQKAEKEAERRQQQEQQRKQQQEEEKRRQQQEKAEQKRREQQLKQQRKAEEQQRREEQKRLQEKQKAEQKQREQQQKAEEQRKAEEQKRAQERQKAEREQQARQKKAEEHQAQQQKLKQQEQQKQREQQLREEQKQLEQQQQRELQQQELEQNRVWQLRLQLTDPQQRELEEKRQQQEKAEQRERQRRQQQEQKQRQQRQAEEQKRQQQEQKRRQEQQKQQERRQLEEQQRKQKQQQEEQKQRQRQQQEEQRRKQKQQQEEQKQRQKQQEQLRKQQQQEERQRQKQQQQAAAEKRQKEGGQTRRSWRLFGRRKAKDTPETPQPDPNTAQAGAKHHWGKFMGRVQGLQDNKEGDQAQGAEDAQPATPGSVSAERHDAAAMRACAALVAEARARWEAEYNGQYIDDISAVVVVMHAQTNYSHLQQRKALS